MRGNGFPARGDMTWWQVSAFLVLFPTGCAIFFAALFIAIWGAGSLVSPLVGGPPLAVWWRF